MLVLIFVLGAPDLAQSQVSQDTLKGTLDTLKVNALRLNTDPSKAPLSFTQKQRSLITRNASIPLTLDQITSDLPGIWVNDRENYAVGERISIRGLGWRASFGVRGIQIVLDDIPLTVADGQSMLNSIDPAFIKEMEIVRGPASSFWGNSSGGVLYLSTPNAFQGTPALKIRSSIGSYGTTKQEVLFSESNEYHDITGYASYLYEGGYRDHSSAKVFRSGVNGSVQLSNNSGIEYMGAFVAMPQAKSPSSLTKQKAQNNPTQADSGFVQSDAGKQVYQAQLGTNYYIDSSVGYINLTAYGIYRNLTNPLPFAIINLDRWAGGIRGTIERSIGSLNVKAGFDTKLQRDDRLETDNSVVQVNQLEKVTNQALFITSDLNLGSFSILGGLRYDWLKFKAESPNNQSTGNRLFHALNPSIGIAYQPENIKIYSNLSTSFESPTTTELVNNPNQQSGFNPNLKPEKTLGLEAGIKGTTDQANFSYDIALYNLWITDILFPYQLTNNGPTYYRNEGETIHRGIESSFNVDLHDNFSLGLTYNFTDAFFQKALTSNNTSLKNNDVPGIPDHRLNISGQYVSDSWLFSTSYQFVSRYAVNNANTAFNSSYNVVDAKLSYVFSFPKSGNTIQPFLNVNNIFDTQYNGSVVINAFGDRYYEPAAGINWQLGLSFNIK
ncbi:MAG: TonB-dependent receptor [Balneolaceae bacterium]|nr:TonB-dependent receptor [Balneolaceae bacterium]